MSESREKKMPGLFSRPEARGRSHWGGGGGGGMQRGEHTKEERQKGIKVTY